MIIARIKHLIGHFQRTLAMKHLTCMDSENDNNNKDNLMISRGYLGKIMTKERNTKDGSFTIDYTSELVEENVENNINDAKSVFPGIDWENYKLKYAFVDRFGSWCIDDIPVIDEIILQNKKDGDNGCQIVFATGWTGHGWAISPAVSQLLVQWIQDGTKPQLLAPFNMNRFRSRKGKSDRKMSKL